MDKAREEGAQGILVVREIRAWEQFELVGRWKACFQCQWGARMRLFEVDRALMCSSSGGDLDVDKLSDVWLGFRMMFILSVFAVFVVKTWLEGGSRVEARELAVYYLRGREASTIVVYGSEYKKLVEYCENAGESIFELGEKELMLYLIFRSKSGVSESQMKQALSVVTLIYEVCGFESPSKSSLVINVKKGIIKQVNKSKESVERIGMTKSKLMKIFDAYYDRDFAKVLPENRRFLIMKTICFLAAKRFSDIQKLKRKDIKVDKDGRVKIWMARSKTDAMGVGCHFKLTKSMLGSVSVTELIKWYLRSLGAIGEDGYVFPVFRKGKAVEKHVVSYDMARKQLLKERVLLGLGQVSWHSGRIGGASEAARKGLSRSVIMHAGGWRSRAVDSYIRVQDAGVQIGDAVL